MICFLGIKGIVCAAVGGGMEINMRGEIHCKYDMSLLIMHNDGKMKKYL